jgi:SAM-dependent methyltransferase
MEGAEPTHSDLLLQETGRRRYRAIIESLSATRPKSVLDLGCGEGNLATMLSKGGLELNLLLGCDLDRSKLLKAARKRVLDGRAAYIIADAENLPLKPGSFAMIVATEILEHVPDEARCLSELRRLAPDRILITVPALRYPMFLFAMGSERLDAWLKKDLQSSSVPSRALKAIVRMLEGPGLPLFLLVGILRARRLLYYDYRLYHGNLPHRLYTTAYLVALLRRQGFNVERARGVGFSIPFVPELEVLLRRRGITSLAQVLAKVQTGLDEHFSRDPNHSQNIMVVGTIEGHAR